MPKADTSTILNRDLKKGGRTKQQIRTLQMYRQKAKRDDKGHIVGQVLQSKTPQGDGRIAPNRKWFDNTRVIDQSELDKMREVLNQKQAPNTFLIHNQKLPTQLIHEMPETTQPQKLLDDFQTSLNQKGMRKQPANGTITSIEALSKLSDKELQEYKAENDYNYQKLELNSALPYDPKLTRASTNRVFGEVYKVIDSSDVIIYVLDARDPMSTRSKHIEEYLMLPENEHRNLIYVLNKCDLVPIWVVRSYIQILSQIHPTIAFSATSKNLFGKAELLSILRQLQQMKTKKQNSITVGFLGFPNVGKSSVINAMKGDESCKTAPIAGETKVWQYVRLTDKIQLLDCPGVIFSGIVNGNLNQSDKQRFEKEQKIILQGCIRTESLEYPEVYVQEIMRQVDRRYINKIYKLNDDTKYKDEQELMRILAFKWGKLLKGGEPDIRSIARKLLEDYVRGNLPHFVAPHGEQEIQEYKQRIQSERESEQYKTDSELIKFVNQQRLSDATQKFAFEGEDKNKNQKEKEQEKVITQQISQQRQEKMEQLNKQEDEYEYKQISFNSDDLETALEDSDNDEKKPKQQDKPIIVQHTQKRIEAKKGIQRATRILQTKNQELQAAAKCSLVDEKDIRMVVHEKKKKVHKERQGGFKHQVIGKKFYDEKRQINKQNGWK